MADITDPTMIASVIVFDRESGSTVEREHGTLDPARARVEEIYLSLGHVSGTFWIVLHSAFLYVVTFLVAETCAPSAIAVSRAFQRTSHWPRLCQEWHSRGDSLEQKLVSIHQACCTRHAFYAFYAWWFFFP
jgi:hypothetical protein